MSDPQEDPTTEPEPTGGAEGQEGQEGAQSGVDGHDDGRTTFDAEYVRGLRDENAGYRQRARDAEARAEELHRRLTDALIREGTRGVLHDSTDLPSDGLVDEDGYPDLERIHAAAEELTQKKPHLKERRPSGTVEQGARGDSGSANLADRLRRLAG